MGSARRDVQPLPALTEAVCISPTVQDSDGDNSDCSLVVDEVSPELPAGCLGLIGLRCWGWWPGHAEGCWHSWGWF